MLVLSVGQRFGHLTVAGQSFLVRQCQRSSERHVVCRCACGTSVIARTTMLHSKKRPRRFCSTRCPISRLSQGTHRMSRSRLYNIWSGIKSRTKGTSGGLAKAYYSDRGITVCDEWAASFETFLEWANSAGYRDGLEIDRIDNDRGYSPDNCRWASRVQQMRNTRPRNDARKTSRFRGVSRCCSPGTSNPWRAVICINGRPKHLGVFGTEEAAAAAYDSKAKELFGEFASLNFPRKERAAS